MRPLIMGGVDEDMPDDSLAGDGESDDEPKKRIQIEPSPQLEETIERLRQRMTPKGDIGAMFGKFPTAEKLGLKFVPDKKLGGWGTGRRGTNQESYPELLGASGVHEQMAELARNSPEARTARASEGMHEQMQTLADAAIRADERADQLATQQKSDRRWNRFNAICAAIAAIASIAAIVVAIILA